MAGAANNRDGHAAEQRAADGLKRLGFKIIDLNWRTRQCEIDIIASRFNRLYFIEVKYRRSRTWGSGLDYINAKKLKQMAFAAESWVHQHGWRGDYQLAGLAVDGNRMILRLID